MRKIRINKMRNGGTENVYGGVDPLQPNFEREDTSPRFLMSPKAIFLHNFTFHHGGKFHQTSPCDVEFEMELIL